MQKEKIKELIIQHKEKFLAKTDLVRREIQEGFENFLRSKEVILITGIRRSGKSSLMKLYRMIRINSYGF